MSSGETMQAAKYVKVLAERILRPGTVVAVIPEIVPYVGAGGVRQLQRLAIAFNGRETRPSFISGFASVLLSVDEKYAPLLASWHKEGHSKGALPVFDLELGVDILITAIPRRPVGGAGPAEIVQVRWQLTAAKLSPDPRYYLENKLFEVNAHDLYMICKTCYELNASGKVPSLNGMEIDLTEDTTPKGRPYEWGSLTSEVVRGDDVFLQMIGRTVDKPMAMPAVFRLALRAAQECGLVTYPMTTLVYFVPVRREEDQLVFDVERAVFAPLLRIIHGPPAKKIEGVEALVSISNAAHVFIYVSEDFDPESDVETVPLDELESRWYRGAGEFHIENIAGFRRATLTDLIQRTVSQLRAPTARTIVRTLAEKPVGILRALAEAKTAKKPETKTLEQTTRSGQQTQGEGETPQPPLPLEREGYSSD